MTVSISPEALDGIWAGVNAFSGAAVGACFYVLTKTQPYLANRSYDPKYNAAYISRFIIGVISGVILAVAIGPGLAKTLNSTAATDANAVSTFETLTPGVLAILGGYAAEAVELILQRLAEILLAMVRGDGSSQVQARNAADQNVRNIELLDQLAQIEAAGGDAEKIKASIDRIRGSVRKASGS